MGARAVRGWAAAAVAVLAAAGCVGSASSGGSGFDGSPSTAPTEVATSATSTSPVTPSPSTGPVPELDGLVVAEPDPDLPPYRRAAFGDDWDYDPASGCNTRERVLIAESLEEPTMGERCKPLAGVWVSAYDGVETTDPADLQIDHVIPLAEAWRSGASRWSDERRRQFANDLSDPATLIAITGSSNQSKGDSTPDQWMPPDRAAWCTYARDWARLKKAWALTVTAEEARTLGQVIDRC